MTAFSFVQPVDALPAKLYEQYHENSKLNQYSTSEVLTSEQIYISSRPVLDSFEKGRPIKLDQPPTELGRVIASRRSARELQQRVQFDDLATLIWAAAGITGYIEEEDGPLFALRTSPSAGGLCSVDLYVVARNAEGLDKGVYYFHPFKQELQLVKHADPQAVSESGFLFQNIVAEAAIVFLLVANFQRVTWKYGERGYRLCLLDAGHLAQNLLLMATQLGCTSLPVAGFNDDLLASYLGIDGVTEAVVHSVLVGGHGP